MNRNLGNYDMVLALSASKINYQFKKMYQRKIIHRDWAFLTNSMGKDIKNLTNEEAKSFWNNVDTNKSNLEAKKAELESLDQQMMTAIDQDKWDKVKELKSKKKTVKAGVDDLKRKINEANLYDLGLIATIAEPKIDILSGAPKELIFQISFKSGKLFYTREGKKAEYDLGGNGIKYAFRVSIGKVKITSDKKIVEISEDGKETEKTLRDKGINDNDFTIQALFLDFENANIANYDSESSTLPDDAENNALLQAAMVNYFKGLANTDNPYVLGYGIHKNEVQEGERGLFYPTGVAYSTSHSREKRASTFNFLMLLNNHAFPSSNDAGVLPTSLMEYAQDKTGTVNGVFGLNMSEFEDNYIPLLSKLLHTKIKSNMESRYKSSYFNNKDIYVNFGWHNVKEGTLGLQYQGIQPNSAKNGVDIRYAITAKAEVHQEIKEGIGTVGVDWDVSTSGKSDPKFDNKRKRSPAGHEGTLVVTLKAGASGKLELKLNYSDKFKLGFDSSTPRYKDDLDKSWDDLNKYAAKILDNIFGIDADIGKNLDNLVSIDNVGAALNIERLENLENKVILPVASVYTYKNVRVFSNDSGDKKVLLFDTSYGAVAQ